jgi:hypothetical protein
LYTSATLGEEGVGGELMLLVEGHPHHRDGNGRLMLEV